MFKMFCPGVLILFLFSIDLTLARRLVIKKRFDQADFGNDDSGKDDLNIAQIISQGPWSATDLDINPGSSQDTSDLINTESNRIDPQETSIIADSTASNDMPNVDWGPDHLDDDEQNPKKTKPSANPCGNAIYLTCGGPAAGNRMNPLFVANCVKGKPGSYKTMNPV